MLIDIRCQHCSKLLCRVSRDFYGVVEVVCLRCRGSNTVSLAVVLKQLRDSTPCLHTRVHHINSGLNGVITWTDGIAFQLDGGKHYQWNDSWQLVLESSHRPA